MKQIKIAAHKNIKKFPFEVFEKLSEHRPKPVDIDENDSILSLNDNLLDHLFEGDILLTVPQAKKILLEIEYEHFQKRHQRQADPDPSSFWSNLTIPYTFHPDYKNDTKLIDAVKKGLNHIEKLTCVRFVAHESKTELGDLDFLEYFRAGGCWSPVGRRGGGQQISIGYGCDRLDIVAHETLHALGLWHEQSRYDRDDYILINYDAIISGMEYNFMKRTAEDSDNLGTTYDIGSTMHYPSRGFSKDRKSYTIVTKDPNFQQTMGYHGGLSFKDARMINKRYCKKICNEELECFNDGYTDPNNCDQCLCSDGYSGTFCQETPNSINANCSNVGFLMAGEWAGTITTGQLQPSSECYWRIIPSLHEQRIEISITKMEFPCSDVCSSYLEVKAKREKISTGARLCCGTSTTIYGDVDADVILILKISNNINGTFQGAELTYKSVNASITVPIITQTIPTTTIGQGTLIRKN